MTTITLIIIILMVLISSTNCGFFSREIDKLKSKAKSAFSTRFGSHKSVVNMFGQDLSEYPGLNKKYKQENQEKWLEYYQCLEKQEKQLNNHRALTPEAVLGFETSSIKLDCKICLSPAERQDKDSIIWEFASQNQTTLTLIEYSDHILLSPSERALKIFNLNIGHSGQYRCRLGNTDMAPYYLTVISMDEMSFLPVHSDVAPQGPYSQPYQTIDSTILLDTQWLEWSECNKCDRIGKRHRLGYCVVVNVTNEKLFDYFLYGVPCQSHILPDSYKDKVIVRKNEIMTGYCNVKCQSSKIYEVHDKNGKVLEQANNTAGIYSMSQPIPQIEPPVERIVRYEIKGKDFVIECPGNVNKDIPIHWQIGDKNIIPDKLAKESNGRVFVSITDRIHIRKAKLADSNIYSCWQLNELAGTVRLVVEKRFEFNFNHTIMLFATIVILGMFFWVFVKIVANRDLTTNNIKYARL